MKPWGSLGDTTFELLTAPVEFSVREGMDYHQHKLINTRPRIERTSAKLQELSLRVRWHRDAINPEFALRSLSDDMRNGTVLDFVKGQGDTGIYMGQVVITNIEHNVIQELPGGLIQLVEATLSLLEWNPDPVMKIVPVAAAAPALKKSRGIAPSSEATATKKAYKGGNTRTVITSDKAKVGGRP